MTEESQQSTVTTGEAREAQLARRYAVHMGHLKTRRRPPASDIDLDLLDDDERLIGFLEIKERTNSINAYRLTMFPYAKINEAKKLIQETGLPVFIILKFTDCWARIRVDPDKEYSRGDKPFAPRYRPWQNASHRQLPVMIPVEELEVLPLKDECLS